ncbi:MAG: RNA polymerase sigma factor [Ignavibacteriota bacterium]
MKQNTYPPENSTPVQDSEDLAEQLNRSMPAIRQWLKTHITDQESCAEILQETLLAALQGISRFQESAAFSTWLIGIAKNKALEYVRRERRKGSSRNGREDFDERLHSDTGAGAYSSIDISIDLERLLSVLNEEQCEDIRLHYIDGYSMEELAAMRGCSRGAMKVRVKRVMDRMRIIC